jgi:hypothetical protein
MNLRLQHTPYCAKEGCKLVGHSAERATEPTKDDIQAMREEHRN